MKLRTQDKSKLYLSVSMVLIALIVLVTGTYAWFTLSLTGKVNSMELQVTAGEYMRIDVVDNGNNIENWDKHEVTLADVEGQLTDDFGATTRLTNYKLEPVTSGNGKKFYKQSGTAVEKSAKSYLQFDLFFIATRDMDVYLTEDESSSGAEDGTLIEAKTGQSAALTKIENCIRASFLEDGNAKAPIYEPDGSSNTTLTVANARNDAGKNTQTTFSGADTSNDDAHIFSLTANESKKLTVTIWVEGDDAQCTDDVKLARFLTRLRFEGV